MLSFQNCSSGFFQQTSSDIALKASPLENGHGYGGKPDVDLYRFVENYSCGTTAVAPEIIQWRSSGEYVLVKTDIANSCRQTEEPINSQLLNFSIFQNEFLSYNDFLFTAAEGNLKSRPETLAEALCRDNFESPKLEIIAHYNSAEQTAKVTFFGEASDVGREETFVARLFSKQNVVYKTVNYSLGIELASTLNEGGKRFVGTLQSKRGQQTLTCILGGGLDIGLFSIQNVVSDDIAKFYVNDKNRNQSFYELPLRDGQYLFQKVNQQAPSILSHNGKVWDLQQDLLADCEDCRYLKLSSEKNRFISYGDSSHNGVRLYSVDLESKKSSRINYDLGGLVDYWVLKNAAYFFIKNPLDATYSLISYHMDTESTQVILDSIKYDFSFHEAIISKSNNVLLIYAKRDSRIPLIVVNDSTQSAKVVTAKDLNLPTKVFDYYRNYNVWGALGEIPGKPHMLFTMRESLDINNFDTDIYFFNPFELSLKKVWHIPSFLSRHLLGNGRYLLGCNTKVGIYADCIGQDDIYLNLSNGEATRFSASDVGVVTNRFSSVSEFIGANLILKMRRFSESSDVLYGGGTQYGLQYGFNVLTKERKALCPELKNDIFISYFNSKEGKTFQLAVNSSERSLSIIRMDGLKCSLLSKIPYGTWSALSDFAVTAAGVGLVFDSKELGSSRQHVVFAPFSGRPPILLNGDFKPFLSAEQILASEEGGQLYLIGQNSETGNRNIFKFRPF